MPHPPPDPLEIILTTEKLVSRSLTGSNTDTLLSGHVVLNLTEATNIREVTLHLVGKARLPHGDTRATWVIAHIIAR